MIRKASIMYVHKHAYEEYEKRHNELWPEMAAELKAHGAHHYSIFLDEKTGQLFAYVEIESEEKWERMAETDVCQRWWKYMAPLMKTNEDHSPVSLALKQVFYLN
ncbi:L-rhamnose mutarotase [Bacillus sp. FJAT-50079]|uniref:L-rhamnose mutarotase n=1 Tax=Bacillus sp. FJAT-50079 TaxID=2833577 RepID=UPI001BC9B02F|nr:L-rhamnose mutarotase [Bacillus sp. FJAT-50079]MBS4207830.1 L-rhamnose mutarotase [Bacillus sp. FJAT-50079]